MTSRMTTRPDFQPTELSVRGKGKEVCQRSPHFRSERLDNNEDIKGTATAVDSPVVK